MKTLRRSLLFCTAALATVAVPAKAELILDWNTMAVNAIQAKGEDVAQASRDLAILSTAIFDAVNGIDGIYTPYLANSVGGPAGASTDAAAAAAANTILEALYPAMGSSFTTLYSDQLAAIGNGQAKTDGINWGNQVASAILTARANDGSANAASTFYSPSGQLGRWASTPDHTGTYQFPPLEPGWGNVTPFGVGAVAPYRPSATLDMTSSAYASAFNQVKDLGSATSATRTAAQTTAAIGWAGGAGSPTAAGQWNLVANTLLHNSGISLLNQARLLAIMNISAADAAISAFDNSYLNDNWRPITGIAYGGGNGNPDFDGNPLTTGDEFWNPLVDTPVLPSYMNPNVAIAKAIAKLLKLTFGAQGVDVALDTDGDGIADTFKHYASIDDVLNDATMAPIWGGTDFAHAVDAATLAADQITTDNINTYFLPLTVPEPSSLILAVGALALMRRRRR